MLEGMKCRRDAFQHNVNEGMQAFEDDVAAKRERLTNYVKSTWDKVYDFINGTSITAEYGYRENSLVGIGSIILMPGAFALNYFGDAFKKGDNKVLAAVKKIAAIAMGILVSPITLVGAMVKGFGMLVPVKIGELDSTNPALGLNLASKEHVDQIYSLVTIFHDVSQKHGVPYFAEAGSLLGALRVEGMIQWDDDFDAGVMEVHESKIEGMRADLEAQGILLQDRASEGHPHVYNLSFTDEVMSERYGSANGKKAFMDLFVFREFKDGSVRYKNNFMRNQFSSYYFIKGDTDDDKLVSYNFGPKIPEDFPSEKKGKQLQVMSVNRQAAEGIVHRYYGKDCLEYGWQTHRHTSLFGIPLPIPNLSRAKYKIVKEYATGNAWVKV